MGRWLLRAAFADQRGIGQLLPDRARSAAGDPRQLTIEGEEAPVDRVGRGFPVSECSEFYGSAGIVLNTPDGVTAPAP
jgi:hypothetical protein